MNDLRPIAQKLRARRWTLAVDPTRPQYVFVLGGDGELAIPNTCDSTFKLVASLSDEL